MVRHLALAALATLVLAAPAQAATFGSDLSPAVTAQPTCANQFGTSSCLAYGVQPTSYPPFSGVVSKVRVKSGDFPQGPMQVVILRSYYQNNPSNPGTPNFFCCFVQEYGPTFTPDRNTITEVPVTLGMAEDPTPAANDGNTVAKGDFLALSSLSGNGALPLIANQNALSAFNAPAPTPQTFPAPSEAISGGKGGFPVQLLMNADISPLDAAGTPPPAGGTPGTPAPTPAPDPGTPAPVATPPAADPNAARPVALGGKGLKLAARAATVPVSCTLTSTCTGTLALAPKAPAKAKATAAAVRSYGSARFTVAAGKTASIKVKLSAAGRRALKAKRRVKVYATATVNGVSTTTKLTLKR